VCRQAPCGSNCAAALKPPPCLVEGRRSKIEEGKLEGGGEEAEDRENKEGGGEEDGKRKTETKKRERKTDFEEAKIYEEPQKLRSKIMRRSEEAKIYEEAQKPRSKIMRRSEEAKKRRPGHASAQDGAPRPSRWYQKVSKSYQNGAQNDQLGFKRYKLFKMEAKWPRRSSKIDLSRFLGLLDMKKSSLLEAKTVPTSINKSINMELILEATSNVDFDASRHEKRRQNRPRGLPNRHNIETTNVSSSKSRLCILASKTYTIFINSGVRGFHFRDSIRPNIDQKTQRDFDIEF
jgi:hypothetical protein